MFVMKPQRSGKIQTVLGVLRVAAACCAMTAGSEIVAEPTLGDSDYLTETWRAEDGLPNNSVTCVTQTRDGYLWLGTQQGLARFDGNQFRVFDTSNTTEFGKGRITALFEDRQGVLWAGTEGAGIVRFEQGRWHHSMARKGSGHEVVTAIGEDSGGELWVGTPGGLCRWNDRGMGQDSAAAGMASGAVLGLCRDGHGMLWALAGNVLGQLKDGQWSIATEVSGAKGVTGLFRDSGGSLWVFGDDLLLVGENGQLSRFLPPGTLAGHAITAMCETTNGDFWLGTRAGVLLRVRGGQLATFEVSRSAAPSPVRCLLEDGEGNLWVGTDGGGLSRMKPRHIKTFTSRDGLRNEVITSLAEDGAGGLWVGTKSGGLHRWRNGLLAPIEDGGALRANTSIGPLCRTRDGSLWIGTFGEGLFRLKQGEVSHYGSAEGLTDGLVLSLFEDHAGTLWIGTYEGGLHRFDNEQLVRCASQPEFGASPITCLAQQPGGEIWLGTGGMGVFRLRNERFEQFGTRQGLGSDFIQTLFVDSAGLLWVGTGGGGLARLAQERFVCIHTGHGLRENVVSQILEDVVAGNLWLGGNRGLSRVPRRELNELVDGLRTTVSPLAFGKTDGMESLECSGGFSPAGLRSLDDRLWFATVAGLVQVTPFVMGNTLPGITADHLSFGDPRLIFDDGSHCDLSDVVGGGNGAGGATAQGINPANGAHGDALDQIFVDGGVTDAARYHPSAHPFIDGVFIPDGGIARDGRVTISSSGLRVVLPDTTGENYACISRFSANPNPAPNRRRQTLGEVDYSSAGRGILNMSGNAGITFDLAAIRSASGRRIERFSATAGNGWVGPACFHVFLDGERMVSQNDVLKDLDHPNTNVFPLDIPIPPGARFLTLVTTDDKDNPRCFTNRNSLPPPVQIEEILVDGVMITDAWRRLEKRFGPHLTSGCPESSATGVTLEPGQEQLEIRFTALSFTAPDKVRFKYRLEGFDPDWVEAGETRLARYTKVPPGKYRFHVLARNSDGVWNEIGAAFALTVIPPFWNTWWFRSAVILGTTTLVVGIVRFAFRRRMQRKLDRLRQQHAVEQERTRIARDMHDEIGAELAKISFLSELAKRDLTRPSEAAKQIDRMSTTARNLIRAMDEIVWAVNPKNDTLEDLANYICRHAEDYFQDTDLCCRFEIPLQVPNHTLSTDARHNLFLAVKEALHNALKHSGATEVCVRIEVRGSELMVLVSDNGSGLPAPGQSEGPAAGHRVGNGLPNMRRRLESIGGHFAIASEPGCGTTVSLALAMPSEPPDS